MSTFVVKRKLPGITADKLNGAGLRVMTCAEALCTEGTEVRWFRSFFLRQTEETHCYFEASDANIVKRLNDRAQIPYVEILEVQEMTPDSV